MNSPPKQDQEPEEPTQEPEITEEVEETTEEKEATEVEPVEVEEPVSEPEPAEVTETSEPAESEKPAELEKEALPDYKPGDTVKVHLRVKEGERERMQVFEGVVISKRGSKEHKTFTVRKISFGVGVEKIFPECSPVIAKLEVVAKGNVRRAKLYYLRDRVGKAAKIKQKREY